MTPIKILLAEDDIDDRELFCDFIIDRQDIYMLPVAENGAALMELLEVISNSTELPDIIILDQNMPVRNGLQTLELLKENERYSHIPVLIYSTYTDDHLINACSVMGASGVFAKPLTRQGYDEMFNEFLKLIGKPACS